MQVSDTEFEVFRDHLKLRLDVEALQTQGNGGSTSERTNFALASLIRF